MGDPRERELSPSAAAALSSKELVHRLLADVADLAKSQVALARAEMRHDLAAEVATTKRLGVAALLAVTGFVLAFVTIILGLALVMSAWGAALVVTGVVLVAAAILASRAWVRRPRRPLAQTRREVRATLGMAKAWAT